MSLLGNIGKALGGVAKGVVSAVGAAVGSTVKSAAAPFLAPITTAISTIQAIGRLPGVKTSVGPLPVPQILQPLVGPGRDVAPGGLAPNITPIRGAAPGMTAPFNFGNPIAWLTGGGGGSGRGRVAPGQNGACPKGWHLNKHKLADGTPPRSVCVRNRSMNPTNGRAIARAARRIHRGEKLLRKIFQVEGKRHGKIRPKVGGRKK